MHQSATEETMNALAIFRSVGLVFVCVRRALRRKVAVVALARRVQTPKCSNLV
jgi:hypothetical protein